MQQTQSSRIALMIILLLGVAALRQGIAIRELPKSRNHIPLSQAFRDVAGWPGGASLPMDEKIAADLRVDDYLYRNYESGDEGISLYIGYYQSATKVGAAHDPLVCFKGQGWRIKDRQKGHHQVAGTDFNIDYATMLVERGNQKMMILYWFQADKAALNNSFSQKLKMIWQRLSKGRENNAFVRISTAIKDAGPQAAKRMMLEFVDRFYPQFRMYISEGAQA